jgi:hypothetical protein
VIPESQLEGLLDILRRKVSAQLSAEASDIGIFMDEFEKTDDEAEDSEDDQTEAMRRQLPQLNMQPEFRPRHPLRPEPPSSWARDFLMAF